MLKRLELSGFKSFAKKSALDFTAPITSIVGPNGSGKSNVAESIRFVLGEQSHTSLRTKKGEDLIWNGSKLVPASNRASVSITFDNKKRLFKLEGESSSDIGVNFDEITISREIYRDGISKYLINGSQVRLRDIIELLASVNIGASGHHIISQGEADRILNASLRDRRIMIEEALGLKIYHWKIGESEKKLLKTNENIDKAESLRRELAPHIKFLKKQVEKIEKAESYRQELSLLYKEYLKKEDVYLTREKKIVSTEKEKLESELKNLENSLHSLKERGGKNIEESKRSSRLRELEENLRNIRLEKDDLMRRLGRIEANIEISAEKLTEFKDEGLSEYSGVVPYDEIKKIIEEAEKLCREGESKSVVGEAIEILKRIRETLSGFLSSRRESKDFGKNSLQSLEESKNKLEEEKKNGETNLRNLNERENSLNLEIVHIKSEADKDKDATRKRDVMYYELTAKRSELSASLNILNSKDDSLKRDSALFEEELKEGTALIGEVVLEYKNHEIDERLFGEETRGEQEERRKKIEKIKIRLEDMGAGGGGELLKEYKDTEERDQFLSREIEDLKKSAESLFSLIDELKGKLDLEFEGGIKKINSQFEEFFRLMFGGGSASISVYEEKRKPKKTEDEELPEEMLMKMDEESEPERGIEIKVNLPQKKIKDLNMLSGGERALTSIALLFAISQVNPPPFLVLDETDAALDEANSRKYGDMLENLSKVSQLVVITHNRETMSRARILYGITTAGDGASRLLSIKFEEAVEIAK